MASMLAPEEFGTYLAVGPSSRSRGQAIFFEVDPEFRSEHFPMHLIEQNCVPHPDGRPKNSLYLSVYRVLEHVPTSALGNLYLVTDDGKVLKLEKKPYEAETDRFLHLYQEFCPVNPCVASSLNAEEFCRFVTDPKEPVQLPRLVFSELILRDLATNPLEGRVKELPYEQIEHLREGLAGLLANPKKKNKIIFRRLQQDFFFRTIRNGFFVGDQDGLSHYPMPSQEALEGEHYSWWRSAQVTHSL